MKDSDLTDAQAIARLLETGDATRRDVAALLIYVREYLQDQMIRDLAHFVAHSNRDRGYAKGYVDTFTAHMIDTFTNGGILKVAPIFPIRDVIRRFCNELRRLKVSLNGNDLYRHKEAFEQRLSELLDGVTVSLDDPRVDSCEFEYERVVNNRRVLSFVFHVKGGTQGVVNLTENIGIRCSVF